MAIFHSSSQVIGRSSGKSSVGASAYRAGEKIYNERDGLEHDYTKKDGVVFKEILAPENAPDWATDRAKLWNEVERVEKRKDSQLAREINIALPKELNREQQIELLRNYVQESFVSKGMIADTVIHDTDKGNPHAHIMLTMRDINQEGFGKKNREWNNRENIDKWREQLADHINKSLEKIGIKDRVDHRSYKEQGIDKVPTKHEGHVVRAMEMKGKETEIGRYNKTVMEHNKMLELIDKQLKIYGKQKGEIENGRIENDGIRNSNARSEGGNIRGKEPTEDIGTKILFGEIRGRNEVHSSRNDEPIQSFKESNGEVRNREQEPYGAVKEVRGIEKSEREEVKRDNTRLETRNQGNEGLELQEDRGSIKDSNEPTREPQGVSKVIEQFNSRDAEDRETGLEGQSETICPTSGNISRSNTASVGSLSADDLLNQIANSFKVKEEEKEKHKSKPIVREQPKPKSKAKVKSKSKSRDRGWER